jgi:spore photoproduct lyase
MIYIEEEVADHWRTHEILSRLPDAVRIPCTRYTELLDREEQDFRLQKLRPSLVLAQRSRDLVVEAPPGYAFGARRNFSFAHMLNCIYDCRYCFLQGMNRSASYVIFVNYEDYQEAIAEKVAQSPDEDTWFFSGHLGDSLAFEPVTRFARAFLPFFARLPRAWLELRTKSTQIKSLLDHEPFPNCVVAFSLTPPRVSRELEHQTPTVERRLGAARRLQEAGWTVALRFDPLIWREDFRELYGGLFAEAFGGLDPARLHSVSLGPFRLPHAGWRRVASLYPDEPLFQGPLEEVEGSVGFRRDLEAEVRGWCGDELRKHVAGEALYPDASGL